MGHIAHLKKKHFKSINTCWLREKPIIYFIKIDFFFNWTNINPLHPRIIVPSLVEFGPLVLQKKIFKFRQCVFAIWLLSPLGTKWVPSFEQIEIQIEIESPLHKYALCHVWLKLAHWYSRKIFNFVIVFSLFRSYLPFENSGTLHLNKLKSSLPKDVLRQVWLKLVQWFWRRRRKFETLTTTPTVTTRTTTDSGQILIRKAHLSWRLKWIRCT